MRIAIASDHAGFALKEAVKAFLTAQDREVLDLGTTAPIRWTIRLWRPSAEFCARTGPSAASCSAGAALARRWPRTGSRGIRAGLCHDTYSAHQGVEHDDMNVLVLGGRIVGVELARELIGAFLNARFTDEERHRRRLRQDDRARKPIARSRSSANRCGSTTSAAA